MACHIDINIIISRNRTKFRSMPMAEPNSDPFVFAQDAVFDPACYHHFYSLPPERTAMEVEFLIARLGISSPLRILDLACGHGRHAIALAQRGHTVTGVDRSGPFLVEARAAAAAAGVTVTWREQDMRALADEAAYDVVLCIFTAFGYHTDAENAQVVANAARSLVPGGRLLIDVISRDTLLKRMTPWTVTERGDDVMIDHNRFDPLTGRTITSRTYRIGGKVIRAPFSVRLYHLQELTQLFMQAGLEVEAAWGDWQGSPVTLEAPRLVLLGRRPPP